MVTKRSFIKQYLKDKKMVGAVSPSSKSLGKKMLSNIDFSKDKLIVELGPGTGVFTDLIINKMADDARLLVFELNDNFYNSLSSRINDPRVKIIHDSAEFIHKYIGETEKLDVVISSLPLMVFPEKLRQDVVNESFDCLKDTGKYIQFQYSLQSKKLLESKYDQVKIQFTIKNFPPAFVYNCTKK
ncbi:MAG: methyltransferase domain-containing protein [Flavobacteriales bacterium]|nr:methyltransferase domain-containing protein [Flavobacteriales bacterium]